MVTDRERIPDAVRATPGTCAATDSNDGRRRYLDAWSELHGGYDVHRSHLVRGWLSLIYALAAPLVRLRVAPIALTGVGVLFAVTSVPVATAGAVGLILASLLLVSSALVDSLDGAVAVLRDRSSAFGYVVDSVADRLSDLAAFTVLWVLGAPPLAVLVVAVLTLLQETARARAVSAGMRDIEIVTVWERPSRIITVVVTALGCVFVADTAAFATIGTVIGCVLAVIGSTQIAITMFRRLRSVPAPRGDRTRG